MKSLAVLLIFLPVTSFASCQPRDILSQIRPGAEWSISGDDISTLVWLSTQTLPSKAEVIQAMADCRTAQAARLAQKQQARSDVKNAGLTVPQRLQALLILLDYDQ